MRLPSKSALTWAVLATLVFVTLARTAFRGSALDWLDIMLAIVFGFNVSAIFWQPVVDHYKHAAAQGEAALRVIAGVEKVTSRSNNGVSPEHDDRVRIVERNARDD